MQNLAEKPAPAHHLYTSRRTFPSAERLEKSKALRVIHMLRTTFAARRNLLELFHPSLYDVRWNVAKIASGKVVTINDPAFARHVLRDGAEAFQKGRMYDAIFGRFLGKSSLIMEGEESRTRRRLISPAFNARALKRLEGVVAKHVELMLADWDRAAADGPAEVDLSRAVTGLTMRIAMEAFFSSDLGDAEQEIAELMEEAIMESGSPSLIDMLGLPEWMPRKSRRRADEVIAALNTHLYRLIDARIAEGGEMPETPDLLDILVHAQDEETGARLDREAVRNEVMTLFAAGHETTALSLAWGLDRLAREDAVQEELREAVRAEDDAPSPLIAAAYDEMLRLYPPAFIVGRQACANSTFEDVDLVPGDRVQVAIFMMHRNPKYWPEPEKFDPTRFLPEGRKGRDPFAYIPFGAGQRICVGLALAKMEGAQVLREGLKRFRLRPAGPAPDPLGRITLRTEAPVKLVVERV
ncbi:cytochrome P450 [Rhodovulum sp. DZ06]|uniref:cytochrome P450 n=1 Tax=Rhodovulum sp. DZ06 TaxID=3425126 RepID=UPI003D33AFC2